MTSKLKYLFAVMLLAACTTTPKDDGILPPAVFPQFNQVPLNLENGYKTDFVYGDSIKPIVNSAGDTVTTGIPIKITGKRIHPDSISKPQKIKAGKNSFQKQAYSNIHLIPKNIPTISFSTSNLSKVEIPKILPDNTSHFFISTLGDTIPTGIPFPVKGKVTLAMGAKTVQSQVPEMKDNATANIQYLEMDAGISENTIISLLKDRNGHLWMGTVYSGFSRYDGTYFHHYKGKDGDARQTRAYAMMEDKRGSLWVAKEDGIRKYDGDTFTDFTGMEGLSNEMVLTIMEDSRGNIWIGTIGSGLACLELEEDGKTGSITYFTTKEGLSSNDVSSIIEDKRGDLWIGTYGGGLVKFNPYVKDEVRSFIQIAEKDGLPANNINCLLEDKEGTIWIGTNKGLSRYLPPKENKTATVVHYTEEYGLSNNEVISLLEDHDGAIWIGTYKGLNRYEAGDDGINSDCFIRFTAQEGLSSDLISSMVQGDDGILWIGSFTGGLMRLEFKSFREFLPVKRESFSGFPVIMEDSKGNIWYDVENGVARYTPAVGSNPAIFSTFSTKEGLVDYELVRIFEDSKGRIWLSTFAGLSCFDPEENDGTGGFTNFTTREGLISNRTDTVLEDKKGNFWFVNSRGLVKYTLSEEGEQFTHFTEKEGFPNGSILGLIEDRNGNLWFGSDAEGLYRFEPDNDANSGNLTIFSEKEGLSHQTALSPLEDRQGNIWFGTWGGGVNRFDGKTFTHFTVKEGLSHNRALSLIEDPNGTIWVNTVNRISYITPKKTDADNASGNNEGQEYLVGSFYKNDGLKEIEYFTYQPWLDSKGNIYWGHKHGYKVLDINEYQFNQNQPKVYLREIEINDVSRNFRNQLFKKSDGVKFDKVQAFENYPINLKLPYHQKHLTFYFSALEWRSPHQLKYSHRILGLNNAWSAPAADAKADYRNLPPGEFKFQVRAIGQSQQWSEPFEYTFTINPPWWLTWWAYLIYAILFALMLLMFIRWRTERLKKLNAELEEKVNDRTHQLEKQSKDLSQSLENLKSTQSQLIQSEKMASLGELTAGIAHEIQNPLNFVNNFSEVSVEMMQELREEIAAVRAYRDEPVPDGALDEISTILDDIESNLEKINHHGKRADGIVKGMLQHSRSSSGTKEDTDINVLVDEYLRLAYHGLRAKDKTFNAALETHLDDSIENINIVPQDIGRVVLNLITNAFYAVTEKKKQQPENYEPTVTVSTKKSNNNVLISVEDNGNGIPQAIVDKIFQPFFTTKPTGQGTGLGLSLSYDIVKAHGGELKVKTKEGKGSEFSIVLPG